MCIVLNRCYCTEIGIKVHAEQYQSMKCVRCHHNVLQMRWSPISRQTELIIIQARVNTVPGTECPDILNAKSSEHSLNTLNVERWIHNSASCIGMKWWRESLSGWECSGMLNTDSDWGTCQSLAGHTRMRSGLLLPQWSVHAYIAAILLI